MRWHIGLAEAAGSPRLVAAMTEAQGQMSDLIAYIAHPPELLAWSNQQHARMLTAVRKRRRRPGDADHGRAPQGHRARACRAAAQRLDFRPGGCVQSRAEVQGPNHSVEGSRMSDSVERRDRDAERLAELGYKQELTRVWSSFSNFAISFTIISVLAGCFTTYGQAWNNGGPVAISWGWPIICGFILSSRSACPSWRPRTRPRAGPTGGRPSSADRAGRWFTGWFNVIGLVAVVASVDYARRDVRLGAVQPLGPGPRDHRTSRTPRRSGRSSRSSS